MSRQRGRLRALLLTSARHLTDDDVNRFLPKVRFAADCRCWEWTAVTAKGYGRFRLRGRMVYAHRLVPECKIGRLLEPGEEAMHHCDNPDCVNPHHLSVGTRQQNADDMMRKGRHVAPRGEMNGGAKLTQSQVNEIRATLLASPDITYKELARRYGVGEEAISRIACGKKWPDPEWAPMRKRARIDRDAIARGDKVGST